MPSYPRKLSKQITRRRALQDFYGLGNRDGWRKRDEHVDMVGLNFESQNPPFPRLADFAKRLTEKGRHITS